jgi:phosphoglucomutase
MCLSEVASYCKKQGITLWDMMIECYEKYGYFKETQYAITKKGKEGLEEIAAMMEKLRNNPPKQIGDYKVKEFRDYKVDKVENYENGQTGKTGLPTSNVLYFDLEDDAWCCARPSGTEPKIKFYIGVKGTSLEDSDTKLNALTDALKAML